MNGRVNPYLQPLDVGVSLPLGNPHAVSVHLPTMDDIIGYEEQDADVLRKMQSGYPRFFVNKLVEKLMVYTRECFSIPFSTDILPIMDDKAAALLRQRFGDGIGFIRIKDCCFVLLEKTDHQNKQIRDFIRCSGLFLSSRKAEDALLSLGLIDRIHNENYVENGELFIRKQISDAYLCGSEGDVVLASCGMNAIFAVFKALQTKDSEPGRTNVLQVGCLYVDSGQMIDENNQERLVVPIASDLMTIERILVTNHGSIMAVFTEVPNNPLLDCANIPALSALCIQYGIPLIVDSTFGTPHNLTILPYCDVLVESLTKFACGHGDSIMGAVILNNKSKWYNKLKGSINSFLIAPYYRDSARLAVGIADYKNRMAVIAHNTYQLIDYLERSPAIQKIYSCKPPDHNFHRVKKIPDSMPGLVSVVFDKDVSHYYNRLQFAKGPSLGTNFTLLMPYVYMAHYQMLKTAEGRHRLAEMGLHPELLRFSVGLEPIDQIISNLKNAGI